MFAFYSEFGLKDKKECALGNFLFGLVFYLFVFMGGLCVICVNVYGRRSEGSGLGFRRLLAPRGSSCAGFAVLPLF